jgi:hypothetical protein
MNNNQLNFEKMKMKLTQIASLLLLVLVTNNISAQTPGTLTFTYTQPTPTSPTPTGGSNVLAIWIENSAGTFIKTKRRNASNSTKDHLITWAAKSGGTAANCMAAACNTTDATIGATLKSSTTPTAFGAKTVTWDGKNVSGAANGTVVPDGVYKVWVESSWKDQGSNNHGTIESWSFTKGPTAVTLTPTSTTGFFNTITLNWQPSNLGVEDLNSDVPAAIVFPNPSTGIFNIDFNKEVSTINVSNLLGQVVLTQKANDTSAKVDLSNYENGIYIITVSNDKGNASNYKVILNK